MPRYRIQLGPIAAMIAVLAVTVQGVQAQEKQAQDPRRPRGVETEAPPDPSPALPQPDTEGYENRPSTVRPEDWPTVKCNRYKQAYAEAIRRLSTRGISQAFIESHDAFLASNCTAQADVCPRSKEELNLANTLVILGMNQGMASTFLPFACRKKP